MRKEVKKDRNYETSKHELTMKKKKMKLAANLRPKETFLANKNTRG